MPAVVVPVLYGGQSSSCENDAKCRTNPEMMGTDATGWRSTSSSAAGVPGVTVEWAREDEATVFVMKENINDQMARVRGNVRVHDSRKQENLVVIPASGCASSTRG